MNRTAIRNLALAACTASMLASCANFQPKPPPKPVIPPGPRPPQAWNAELAKTETGPTSIIVDLSDQRAYLFKGAAFIGDTRCSSGKKGFRTPPGEYKVLQKDKNHESNLYGTLRDAEGAVVNRDFDTSKAKVPEAHTFAGAKMPYFMRFHGGYGLHSGIVPKYPASHGCVRLPRIMAQRFFENTELGAPVTVQE